MYLRARSTAVEQEEQCMPVTDTCEGTIALVEVMGTLVDSVLVGIA